MSGDIHCWVISTEQKAEVIEEPEYSRATPGEQSQGHGQGNEGPAKEKEIAIQGTEESWEIWKQSEKKV